MRKRGKVKLCIIHLFVILTICRYVVGRHRLVFREDKSPWKNENVGTVLFDKNNIGKYCWELEELIILSSRNVFQDILPQVSSIDFQNDAYIGLLMDYMDICLEAVRGLTAGKTKHLVLKALADTLAGYLRVYILPMTKKSYYAGNIKYRKAKRLFDLYDELKIFLRSNGAGWKKTKEFHQHVDAGAIIITPEKSDQDCKGLILYPAADRSVEIPMPFLDDDNNPNSIALPFEAESLSSLFSEKSAFVLVKYYVAGEKCLSSRSTKGQLEKFRRQLADWIHEHVYQHLDEENFYPAFGGVLKITASLEVAGLKSRKSGEPNALAKTHDKNEPVNIFPTILPEERKQNEALGRNELVVIAVASALLIWLLLGMTLICWKILATRSSSKSQKDTPVAVLYENRKYPSPAISSTSEGGIFKSLKKHWRRRRNSSSTPRCDCPSDDDDDDDDDDDGDEECDEERCLGSVSYSTDEMDRQMERKRRKKRTKFTSVPSQNSTEHRSYGVKGFWDQTMIVAIMKGNSRP